MSGLREDTYDDCWIDRHRGRFFLVDPRTRSQISVMVSHDSRHCSGTKRIFSISTGFSFGVVVWCGLVFLFLGRERRWEQEEKKAYPTLDRVGKQVAVVR